MIVRLGHSWMTRIELKRDVIDVAARCSEIGRVLVSVEILEWDHIDGADNFAIVVIGEERAFRQRLRINVKSADAPAGSQEASRAC